MLKLAKTEENPRNSKNWEKKKHESDVESNWSIEKHQCCLLAEEISFENVIFCVSFSDTLWICVACLFSAGVPTKALIYHVELSFQPFTIQLTDSHTSNSSSSAKRSFPKYHLDSRWVLIIEQQKLFQNTGLN